MFPTVSPRVTLLNTVRQHRANIIRFAGKTITPEASVVSLCPPWMHLLYVNGATRSLSTLVSIFSQSTASTQQLTDGFATWWMSDWVDREGGCACQVMRKGARQTLYSLDCSVPCTSLDLVVNQFVLKQALLSFPQYLFVRCNAQIAASAATAPRLATQLVVGPHARDQTEWLYDLVAGVVTFQGARTRALVYRRDPLNANDTVYVIGGSVYSAPFLPFVFACYERRA